MTPFMVIYVRSSLVRVNPTLYLLGYRVLAVRYGVSKQQYLLTQVGPLDGETVSVVDAAGVLFDTGGPRAHR
jgi:hypothetical protein